MKRTIALVAGLATLAAAYFGSQLVAQTGAPIGQPPAATKIAVINIGAVFMKYEKAKFFKQESETILKPFRDEGEKLRKLVVDWQTALAKVPNPLTEEQKKTGERTIIDCKRRLEDLEREARVKIGKRNEEQLVQLYKEIDSAVKGYAQSNGIHLVLGYGEPTDQDLFSFMNIGRKMGAMDNGGVIPLYASGGLEISEAVVQTLNRSYVPAATPTSNNVTPAPVPGQK